jgi:hypothetical protein
MSDDRSEPAGASRRRFLQQLSSAGLAFGGAPWLVSCGGGSPAQPDLPLKEARTYYFNLSGAHPDADYFLVAGTVHHKLVQATPAHLSAVRLQIPTLPANGVTHVAEQIPMSAHSPQMCYVKGVHGPGPGDWQMHNIMYHIPAQGAAGAALARNSCKAAGDLQRQAFAACPDSTAGLEALIAGATNCDPPAFDNYKDYFDHAVALVSNHPEIGSFDAASLAYIQQNIICQDPAVFNLAVSLVRQGPATATGGWATLVPFIDPDTGKPKLDANGQQLCTVIHSPTTLNLAGIAIQSVLPKVKDDPQLGVNITSLSTDQHNTALQGKMWTVRNGTPTAPGAGTASSRLFTRNPLADASATFASKDVSTGPGFAITDFVAVGRTVSFTVSNWYLRYLGLYARFLDGKGAPIPLSALSVADQFPYAALNGTYDGFISMINQELVVLAIPVQQDQQGFTITVPEGAATVRILAGGLGTGSKLYPSTTDPGAIMTVALDLALPGLFLTMAAVSGYASLSEKLSKATKILINTAQVFLAALVDGPLYDSYHDPSEFKNLISPLTALIIQALRGGEAAELGSLVSESLAEGEAEAAIEDACPFGLGLVLQAIVAGTVVVQISETSDETGRSPWTYVTDAAFTHDLTVTINHDPLDVAGFPATATSYRLLAVCDGSSPRDSGPIPMPAGTRTTPLTYTFKGLPSGGNVNISVTFQSANDRLVGAALTGNISNIPDTASITIKELLVPLTGFTRYSHKEKTALDTSGHHVWLPTTTVPSAPALVCNNDEGNLCELVGITLSEPFGAIGYGWKASSTGVRSVDGGTGQLYQFANISFTENPQAGYMTSGIGFPAPARIAYDRVSPSSHSFYIDTSGGGNLVRRIVMTGVDQPPTFDAPGSHLAVGRFNFASDAFLIHPTGKLISFNSERSKMEVLTPSDSPTADADAVQAQSYSGPGSRDGLLKGPVCAAVAHDGSILVLEAGNNRIQAFDTGANPAPIFGTSSTMPLQARSNVTYLDVTVESTGFIYVLLLDANGVFVLDIYKADGTFLSSTPNVPASKIAVDLFRNTYTLNFENIRTGGSVEPSVSQWIPST